MVCGSGWMNESKTKIRTHKWKQQQQQKNLQPAAYNNGMLWQSKTFFLFLFIIQHKNKSSCADFQHDKINEFKVWMNKKKKKKEEEWSASKMNDCHFKSMETNIDLCMSDLDRRGA